MMHPPKGDRVGVTATTRDGRRRDFWLLWAGQGLSMVGSEVVIVAPVEGVAVPAAAVVTRTDGSAYVKTRDGDTDVQVKGSGQGIVIVEGLDEGTEVEVTAATATSVSSQTDQPTTADAG